MAVLWFVDCFVVSLLAMTKEGEWLFMDCFLLAMTNGGRVVVYGLLLFAMTNGGRVVVYGLLLFAMTNPTPSLRGLEKPVAISV